MLVFRFLSALFLLAATVAFVSDATPYLDGPGSFHGSTLLEYWAAASKETLSAAESLAKRRAPAWAWNGFTAVLSFAPAFLLFGALAAICGYLGRRRRSVDTFAN